MGIMRIILISYFSYVCHQLTKGETFSNVLRTDTIYHYQTFGHWTFGNDKKNGKRKVQGVPQSQTTTLPRHQKKKETDKTKQAQIEQTYQNH